MAMNEYSVEELAAIYELGRLYYEMGYLTPAERIFNGLCAANNEHCWARLGLGLIKIERGMYEEALRDLRLALQYPQCELQAKIAISAAFIAAREYQRAQSLLRELRRGIEMNSSLSGDEIRFFEALELSCQL